MLYKRGAARIRTGDKGFAVLRLKPLGHGADAETYNVCNHSLGVKANS